MKWDIYEIVKITQFIESSTNFFYHIVIDFAKSIFPGFESPSLVLTSNTYRTKNILIEKKYKISEFHINGVVFSEQ